MANQHGNSNVTDFRTLTQNPEELARINGILAERVAIQRNAIRVLSVAMILPLLFWVGFWVAAYKSLQDDCVKPLHAALSEKVDAQAARQNVEKAIAYVEGSGILYHPCTSNLQSSPCGADEDIEEWLSRVKDLREFITFQEPLLATRWVSKKVKNAQPPDLQIRATRQNIIKPEYLDKFYWKEGTRSIENLPSGLSIYPFNGSGAIWGAISCVVAIIAAFVNWDLGVMNPTRRQKRSNVAHA